MHLCHVIYEMWYYAVHWINDFASYVREDGMHSLQLGKPGQRPQEDRKCRLLCVKLTDEEGTLQRKDRRDLYAFTENVLKLIKTAHEGKFERLLQRKDKSDRFGP